MSEIFARVDGDRFPSGRAQPASFIPKSARSGSLPVMLGVLVAGGLVGAAAFALLPRFTAAPVAAPARIVSRLELKPAAVTEPKVRTPVAAVAEAAPSSAGVSTTPIAAVALAEPPAHVDPRSPSPVPAPATKPAVSVAEAPVRPVPPSIDQDLSLSLPPPSTQALNCERTMTAAECRGAVTEADRHLRVIYDNAVKRGLTRFILVEYQARWSELRRRKTANGNELIAGYSALAYDLEREDAKPGDVDGGTRAPGRSALNARSASQLPSR